jgi:hypothetical protein
MCQNIRTLYDFEPPKDHEVEAAKAGARAAQRFAA